MAFPTVIPTQLDLSGYITQLTQHAQTNSICCVKDTGLEHVAHIPISNSSHCGICGGKVLTHSRCVALRGNHNSTTFSSYTDTFLFPRCIPLRCVVNGMLLCHRVECTFCDDSAESVIVHDDCFSVFSISCKSEDWLERLWIFTAWRVPWRRGPTSCINDDLTLTQAADRLFPDLVPGLGRLPLEIVKKIRDYSSSSLFWRFSIAIKLAEQLSALESASGKLVSTPFRSLPSWDREGLLISGIYPRPYVYIDIDSSGIQAVERTMHCRPYVARPFRRLRLMAIPDMRYTNAITAYSKFGLLRLDMPRWLTARIETWDTNSVPDPSQVYLFQGSFTNYSQRFYTINFQDVTGITFFFYNGKPWKIHAHSAAAPTAVSTWERLPCPPAAFSWVYLPIAANDSIEAFGILVNDRLQRTCLKFRLRLAGDVYVGICPETMANFVYTAAPVVALIHDELHGGPVSLIGAVFRDQGSSQSETALDHSRFLYTIPKTHPCLQPLFSSAPLRNVTRLQILNDEQGFCRGILLDYKNGAQRALGQCRIGVDSATTYVSPWYICYHYTLSGSRERGEEEIATIVECARSDDHHHSGSNLQWICLPMFVEMVLTFDSNKLMGIRACFSTTNDSHATMNDSHV